MIVGKSEEINEKTIAEVESVTQPSAASKVIPLKKCTRCGAELTEEQIFCPHCGQKNDLHIAEDVSDAIAQFNQGIVKQAKKKKKKTKLQIVLLIIVGIIVAGVVGLYIFFNGQVEEIIDEINSSSPSSTTIEADYKALTPVGQFLFRGKIIDAFIDEVSDNAYTSSSSYLVNESALDKYITYKKIGKALNITSDDDTNVMSHIDTVLRLESYEQYNDVRKCVVNSISEYTDCLEYISDAGSASSYYVIKLYVGYAHTYAKSALSSARTYSSGDSLCTRYVNALDTIEEELSDLYYDYGYYSSSSVSSAMSTINDIVSDVSDAEDSVESIINSIPKIN